MNSVEPLAERVGEFEGKLFGDWGEDYRSVQGYGVVEQGVNALYAGTGIDLEAIGAEALIQFHEFMDRARIPALTFLDRSRGYKYGSALLPGIGRAATITFTPQREKPSRTGERADPRAVLAGWRVRARLVAPGSGEFSHHASAGCEPLRNR